MDYVLIYVLFFKFQKMTSFNPLATILSQKPLDGNNYDLWKTNLFIVLDFERIKFITTTPKPQEPTANASEETKKQFADCNGQIRQLAFIFLPALQNICESKLMIWRVY